MCVFCYISKKIRVGRSLLIFFPLILPGNNRCVVCTKYITKRGLFGLFILLAIQNACPTAKAFHRLSLNQSKCLNSNTASNMTAKEAKRIK